MSGPPPGLAGLNALTPEEAALELARCCGSLRWVARMALGRPYADEKALFAASDAAFEDLSPPDWREAFSQHPQIGDMASLRKKFAATAGWASGEQSGAASASEETLAELAKGNKAYKRKFGYIFIVCATGRSAAEMLELLTERLPNDPYTELRIAAGEQAKITRLRLEKLMTESP